MAEYGKFVTRIHHGDKCMGQVVIHRATDAFPFSQEMELKVTSFSSSSERCSPLVVLHTVANDGVLFKLEPVDFFEHSADSGDLEMLHTMCLNESKTAVIPLAGGMEVHLVAMTNKRRQWPCFWGFLISPGLYSSCLNMLNQRCLALVFDLDETLIVANTMNSFDDHIDALGSKMKAETDAQKLAGMSAELKRYMQDRALLKQYVEENNVWDNIADKYIAAQLEMVPPTNEGNLPIMRPVIRLQDRNMIFTRIYPSRKNTSVLVHVRPAWEDLRSYLIAKGRKRFEVFICTASEKEYALEMWRLLDPNAQLINAKQLTERVTCVHFHSGSKKSLSNVFMSANCHPNMAMVIDDRLEVWEDKDQLHVHVVPAFAPYYAPQAENNIPVPILCVARNVACNVRGRFFRDFDDGLSKKMIDVDYDMDVLSLPQPPDVSNYLMVEEETGHVEEAANSNREIADDIAGAETTVSLNEGLTSQSSAPLPLVPLPPPLPAPLLPSPKAMISQSLAPLLLPLAAVFNDSHATENDDVSQSLKEEPVLKPIIATPLHLLEQSSPVREEDEVPESELDPITRRRLLILRHGQDDGSLQEIPIDSSHASTFLMPVQSPAPSGGWLRADEDMSPGLLSGLSGIVLEPESPSFGLQHMENASFFARANMMGAYKNLDQRNAMEEMAHLGEGVQFDASIGRLASGDAQMMRMNSRSNLSNPVTVLQGIAQKCNTKLEFKSLLNTTKELLFSVEVLFGGEKVGQGIGRTRREAKHKAAEDSLKYMASQFISHPAHAIGLPGQAGLTNLQPVDEPVQRWNARDPRFLTRLGPTTIDEMPISSSSGQSRFLDLQNARELNRGYNPIVALKDHCTAQGINLIFKDASVSEVPLQGSVCQVEVAGRIMGRGSGWTWEEAKQQAAAEALRHLKSVSQLQGPPVKCLDTSGPPLQPSKRLRTAELPRTIQALSTPAAKLSPQQCKKNGPSLS